MSEDSASDQYLYPYTLIPIPASPSCLFVAVVTNIDY